MAKHTYHFKHDFNAHNDEKIIDLRMDHGMEGYGVYWYLIEMLANAEEYKLNNNYKRLAFTMRTDEGTLKSIIEEYDLFIVENGLFWSNSLVDRMSKLDELKKRRSEAGKKGGSKGGSKSLERGEDNKSNNQLYVIRCSNENESFIKVGVTSHMMNRRFSALPYKYEIINQVISEGGQFDESITELESKIMYKLRDDSYKPLVKFGGSTECFPIEKYRNIVDLINSLLKNGQKYYETSIAKALLNQSVIKLNQTQAEESKVKESKGDNIKEVKKDILTEYLAIWNDSQHTTNYSPISSEVKKQLKKKITSREKDIENFKELYSKAVNSPFKDFVLEGGWMDFAWCFKSSGNAEKLITGNYNDIQRTAIFESVQRYTPSPRMLSFIANRETVSEVPEELTEEYKLALKNMPQEKVEWYVNKFGTLEE